MLALRAFVGDLRKAEDGASFLEYTVLLGIILAASIGVLSSISGYAGTIWLGVHGVLAKAASGL